MWCKQYVHMMEYYLVTKRHETVTDTGTATTLHCLKAEWEQDNKNRTKKKKSEESTSSVSTYLGPIRTRQLFSKFKEKLTRHDGFFQAFFRSCFRQPPMTQDTSSLLPPAAEGLRPTRALTLTWSLRHTWEYAGFPLDLSPPGSYRKGTLRTTSPFASSVPACRHSSDQPTSDPNEQFIFILYLQ